MRKGCVFLVGAGPGDPELISVKGLKRIREADVILYDFLSSAVLLNEAKKGARKICVGKEDGMHLAAQGSINRMLERYARAGSRVVRLKGGDPLVFSRGTEEALFLSRRGIPFEIIPGITSAFAAPESFGIPLTRRGRYSSIAVLTGRKSSGGKLDVPACDTLVYLMGVAALPQIVERLREAGRKQTMPCAFVERGTTGVERIVTGTLATIVRRAEEANLRPPAVLIVGSVVRYGRRICAAKYKAG